MLPSRQIQPNLSIQPPADVMCSGLRISRWIFTLPVESHGSLINWHSSNTPRLNTHLGMVFEEPSALNCSHTAFSLAFPFPNTEILVVLKYKDWIFWFGFVVVVYLFYLCTSQCRNHKCNTQSTFVLLLRQQVSCEKQEFWRQPNLHLSSYKYT